MSTRGSSYSVNEDILLCKLYLQISQDPITGRCQSQDHFWTRIEEAYNNQKQETWATRSKRSVESRMSIIISYVKELNGCVRQIECMNPSSASVEDILRRAKEMLCQDPKYKKGFKFDHVWHIVKDYEKFKDSNTNGVRVSQPQINTFDSSQSNNQVTLDSDCRTSHDISSFSLNLDEEEVGGTSSCSTRGKKAKLKRKIDDSVLSVVSRMEDQYKELREILKKSSVDKQQNMKLYARNLELVQMKEENKILFKDLNSISDPAIRKYIEAEQKRILQKRAG